MVDADGGEALRRRSGALITIRPAEDADTAQIAQVWHEAWHDAHRAHLPEELVRRRTPEDFVERAPALVANTIVAADDDSVVGFCSIRGDELDPLFVSKHARGSGCAVQLLAEGESLLATRGVRRAWLACVVGNERAARFYARHGWERTKTVVSDAKVGGEIFPIDIWRYEKSLDP